MTINKTNLFIFSFINASIKVIPVTTDDISSLFIG